MWFPSLDWMQVLKTRYAEVYTNITNHDGRIMWNKAVAWLRYPEKACLIIMAVHMTKTRCGRHVNPFRRCSDDFTALMYLKYMQP